MEYRISDRMGGHEALRHREILKQMSDPTLISFAGGNPAADSFPKEDIARFSAELLARTPSACCSTRCPRACPACARR